MQEWIDKLASLEKNKISAPFYSPMGIHIIKWIDRKPGISFEEKREQLLNYLEKNGNRTWQELSAGQRERAGSFRCRNYMMGYLPPVYRKNISRVMELGRKVTWSIFSNSINRIILGICRTTVEQ